MSKFHGKTVAAASALLALAATTITFTPAAAAEKIIFWGPTQASGGVNPYATVVKAFNSSQTKYEVEYIEKGAANTYGTALNTAAQAGALPDVMMVQPGIGNLNSMLPLAKAGLLAPLDGTPAAKTILPTESTTMRYKGKTYAAAFDVTPIGVTANTTLMKKMGIKWPTTYAGLLKTCEAVKAQGKTLFVLAGSAAPNNGLLSQLISATTVFGADPNWNAKRNANKVKFATSAGWKKVMSSISEMNAKGCFQANPQAGTFGTINANIASGNSIAAFVPGGTAVDWKRQYGSTFDVYPLPMGAKESQNRILYGVSYAASINAKTKNLAAAKAFVNYISSVTGQTVYTKVTGSLLNDGNFDASRTPYFRPIAEMILDKKYFPQPISNWPNAQVYVKLGTGVTGLLTGQATEAQVLQSMDAAW
ncbi:MAG: hypothetical protein RLZZ258_252 [Actinomycetota bacterium]|jgi:raffinose/stachyose/melibiose transport system substrate-binding protein